MRQITLYIIISLTSIFPMTEICGQNNNDTILVFNNNWPRFHKGIPTYNLTDILASDSLMTNISSLTIKSFVIYPDFYCEYKDSSTDGKINTKMKDFIIALSKLKDMRKKKTFNLMIGNIKAVDKLNNEIYLDSYFIKIKDK